ncbi:MAG TPA: hypothetical protein VIJ95_07445 [Hanamia sp.]
MKECKKQNALAAVGTAVGVGLIAGFAGTVVMTLCQRAEMKKTGRKPSVIPSKAVTEILNIKPVTEDKSREVSTKIHWVYGTSLGLIRGAMSLFGLKGYVASTLHFLIIWGGKSLMLPVLKVTEPVTKEKPRVILTDVFFHLIYVFTTGWVFDCITCKGSKRKERKAGEDKFAKFRRTKEN